MKAQVTETVGEMELLVAELVDNYVMVVTEWLCSMENDNPGMRGRPEFIEQRAKILAGLDTLEDLLVDLRTSNPPSGSPGVAPASLLAT